MPIVLAIAIALLIGAGLSTQAGVNASLRSALGHPFHAAVVNFAVGGATVLLLAIATGLRPPPAGHFARTSPWMYLGGVIGALYVSGVIALAPRLGAATLMALIVTGQLVAATVIDHYGWLGFTVHPAGGPRLVGVLLLIAGVVLVRRG
ncbi:MAG: DMT family transporter [Gemmatimonadales bacterium]